MNADQRDHWQATHSWAVGLVLAVVIYVLSPFPVLLALSRGYGGMDNASDQTAFLFGVVYYPLVKAAVEWEPVARFYLDGFDLIGVQ